MDDVERLLEEALAARPFVIDPDTTVRVDLTQIDFDALGELFNSGRKATAAARLQASLEQRLDRMVRLNPRRIDYVQKLRDLVDRYNAGSKNIEEFFAELKRLADALSEEEHRHVREQLSEEELAVFDLLTKPDPILTAAQEPAVKAIVRELVGKLNHELLVLDWRHKQATRAAVRVGIERTLDAGLPDVYDRLCSAARPKMSTNTSSRATKATGTASTTKPPSTTSLVVRRRQVAYSQARPPKWPPTGRREVCRVPKDPSGRRGHRRTRQEPPVRQANAVFRSVANGTTPLDGDEKQKYIGQRWPSVS